MNEGIKRIMDIEGGIPDYGDILNMYVEGRRLGHFTFTDDELTNRGS